MSGLRLALFFILAAVAAGEARAADPADNVRILIDQASDQLNVDPEKALTLAHRSAAVAQRLNANGDREALLAETDAIISRALIALRSMDDAEAAVRRGFSRARKGSASRKVFGQLILSMGRVNQYRDNVQLALKNFQSSYYIFRDAGEKRLQAIALQSIGRLYLVGGDGENALKYYAQSDREYSSDPSMLLSSHNNRGSAYLFLNKPQNAEVEFAAALKMASQLGSSKYTTRILINIAEAQVSQGAIDRASATLDRAFVSMNTGNETQEEWKLWELRAQIALARNDYEMAAAAIANALRGIDPATSDATYRQAHRAASQIYAATGRPALALKHLEAVLRLDEATARLTASNAAALMAARFDFANQEARIARLKAKELELQRNYLIVVIAAGTLVLLLLSGGLILITRSRNRERAAKLLLARTNSDLEKAIAAKMEFLATTSHEIRTPLNGILGMTQVMLSDRALGATLRDRISIVHDAGETMRTLVDDILDVAKMETGKLAVGTGIVNLQATLRHVAQLWRLQAEADGIDLVLDLDDCPDMIEGDEGRIRQIVFNLLSNAMKFTTKGEVKIAARAVAVDGGDRLRISVRDSGIGIAREWHESIFALFQQVDGGTTRQYGGTGLGLAICRNLARAMGGDVFVESEVGFGSTFTIDLPLLEPVDMPGALAVGDRPTNVLVIEHNPLTRGMMRAILSDRFQVISFVDGVAEAEGVLALDTVDWVIADAASVEDFDVLFEAAREVPVAIVCDEAPAADVRARAILTKPLTKAALLNIFEVDRPDVAVAA